MNLLIAFAVFVVPTLFIAATVAAASDAQGAFIYILALPICGIVLALAYRFSRARSFFRSIVYFEALFLVLFFLSVVIPPLQFFPRAVIGGVAQGFEYFVGMSPYAWNKKQSEKAKPSGQSQDSIRTD